MSRQTRKCGKGVILLFSATYRVIQASLSIMPLATCDVIAVIDAVRGHCWMLVYKLQCSVVDTEALIECLDSLLLKYESATILGDFNMRSIDWL